MLMAMMAMLGEVRLSVYLVPLLLCDSILFGEHMEQVKVQALGIRFNLRSLLQVLDADNEKEEVFYTTKFSSDSNSAICRTMTMEMTAGQDLPSYR